ncbi:hypothetical protein VPG91_11445 [Nitrospirillum amazonense]|uniref:hypothetical protein n=1 Tax=Nitrospirillum amazonense TaxID=28077 RepID=UPI002DD44C1E|nr:hypothetical protein [Nitrospirillum amazonense]MEC4591603.1 hypothetical protein [Nitrospirillum amazonense]
MTPAEARAFDAIVTDEVRQQRVQMAQERQAAPVIVPWPLVILIFGALIFLLGALSH